MLWGVRVIRGGEMIRKVTVEETSWNDLPYKFEAGTPPIGEAVGMGAAIDYLTGIGMEAIEEHECALAAYALECLAEVPGMHVFGPPLITRTPQSIVSSDAERGAASACDPWWVRLPHRSRPRPATPRERRESSSADVLDDLDQLVQAVTLPAGAARTRVSSRQRLPGAGSTADSGRCAPGLSGASAREHAWPCVSYRRRSSLGRPAPRRHPAHGRPTVPRRERRCASRACR